MDRIDLLLKLQILYNNTSEVKWRILKYWQEENKWGELPKEIKKILPENTLLKKLKEDCEEKHIKYITIEDKEYPQKLKLLPYSPPVLFYKGDIKLLKKEKQLAIIGSRKSNYDTRQLSLEWAQRLSRNGITIISGFAVGVDISAHIGALNSMGDTIAVLGCGIDIDYPSSHTKWKNMIEERGLVLSEYLPGTKPAGYLFPFRNRIIAGLSDAILVVSGMKKSGTMSTVGWALDMGKTIMAVPGFVYYPYSEGPNFLIKNGAVPVVSVEDIMEEMNWEKGVEKESIQMTEEEEKIYNAIKEGNETMEELEIKTHMDRGKLFIVLMNMEIKGIIEKRGNNICLKYLP